MILIEEIHQKLLPILLIVHEGKKMHASDHRYSQEKRKIH